MSILGKVLGGGISKSISDAFTTYVKENGMTERAWAQARAAGMIASSSWRPWLATSTGLCMILWVVIYAIVFVVGVICAALGAEWYSTDSFGGLLDRWDSVGVKLFAFGSLFLTTYGYVRGAGSGVAAGETVVDVIKKVTRKEVEREPMADIEPNDNRIEGVENRVRKSRMSESLDTFSSPSTVVGTGYSWGSRSIQRMEGVHEDPIRLLTVALEKYSKFDVGIASFGGLRTLDEQREMISRKASTIINSRHIHGLALDIICFDENGKYTKEWKYYAMFNDAVEKASRETGIPYEWGGEWKSRDGVHFQMPKSSYPDIVDIPA